MERYEHRDDDLTSEEYAQLCAVERRDGAQKAASLLGVSRVALACI